MFEDVAGRLISGALWGLGAGIVLKVMQRGERRQPGLRPVAKTLVKGYVVASDRVRGLAAEAREGLGDLYAEAQAEHQAAEGAEPDTEAGAEGAAASATNGATGDRHTARRSRTRASAQNTTEE